MSITKALLGNFCVLLIGESTEYAVFDELKTAQDEQKPDLVYLLPTGTPSQLVEQLAEQQCWLKPVLSFGSHAHPRSDYHAQECNKITVREGLAYVQNLLTRLKSQSDYEHSNDRQGLSVLALAHTRQTHIEANWAPENSTLVDYPLLCGLEQPLSLLEMLADMELLTCKPFQRLHQCGHCNSSRVSAREECATCHSSFIEETALVHHYSCGYLAPESEFFSDRQLVCPKCQKEMRHYGVDYDKPGTQYGCSACGETNPDPDVGFMCADCGLHTPGASIDSVDRFHYQLSADGLRALQAGLLPNATITDYVQNINAYFAPRDFLTLSYHSLRVAKRYERQLCGIAIKISNYDTLVASIGRQAMSKSFVLLGEVIAQNLRETDLLTAREQELYVVLPETDANNTGLLIERLTKQVESTVSTPLEFKTERFDIESLETMLSSLS